MRVLVSGGLGFVGVNYAASRLRLGDHVVVLDDGSRGPSCGLNAQWLVSQEAKCSTAGHLRIVLGSVETYTSIVQAIQQFDGLDVVLHAAAQSSVDRSMTDPVRDFQSNVVGTVMLLETLRQRAPEARVVFLASNKVYDVSGWPTVKRRSRYCWSSRRDGPSETVPFYTDALEPYAASKIAGFYYCRAYAKMYGLPISICVPSGMYGPRQFGQAEQGWMGWFAIATELGLPITIRGDGYQVRDMCYVEDVCRAIELLADAAKAAPGEVYNLGGGPRNAIALGEALGYISEELGKAPVVAHGDWRPHDNKVYVSCIDRLRGLGWNPVVSVREGIHLLCQWVKAARAELEELYMSRPGGLTRLSSLCQSPGLIPRRR